MATLYKRAGSEFWYAKFFDGDGKRVSKNTGRTKKREAKQVAETLESEARNRGQEAKEFSKRYAVILQTAAREAEVGELTLARTEELMKRIHRVANPDFEEISLEDFWKRWITEQSRHVAAHTAENYRNGLEIFSSALGAKIMRVSIGSLTTAQISDAVDKAKGKGLRRSATVNKALASLRRVMEEALAAKLTTHNPAKLSRMLQEDDSIIRAPFTAVEIRAMLDHPKTSDEWRGAIILAAHTGLRLSDVTSLGRQHIDGTNIVIMPGKTAKRQKKIITIPLTPPCLSWIGERKGDFFPRLKSQPVATTSMQFRSIMRKANVPKTVDRPGGIQASRSFHSLRHTFTSWLANADVQAEVRQKLTGHASAGIHARYTHLDEALVRAVGSLPSLGE